MTIGVNFYLSLKSQTKLCKKPIHRNHFLYFCIFLYYILLTLLRHIKPINHELFMKKNPLGKAAVF